MQPDQGTKQGHPYPQTKHQQEYAEEGDHQPPHHVEHGRNQKNQRGHHEENQIQGKQGYPRYLLTYLEIIIKNHVLELQNIELEINLQIQERMIVDMRQIIITQKNILE